MAYSCRITKGCSQVLKLFQNKAFTCEYKYVFHKSAVIISFLEIIASLLCLANHPHDEAFFRQHVNPCMLRGNILIINFNGCSNLILEILFWKSSYAMGDWKNC